MRVPILDCVKGAGRSLIQLNARASKRRLARALLSKRCRLKRCRVDEWQGTIAAVQSNSGAMGWGLRLAWITPIAQALCSGIQDRARETLHETLQLRFEIESRMKNFSAWNWLDKAAPGRRRASPGQLGSRRGPRCGGKVTDPAPKIGLILAWLGRALAVPVWE